MHGKSENPCDRPADIKHGKRVINLENGADPDDAEQTGTHQRHDHRHDSIAHTPHDAHDGVHPAADEIAKADDLHPLQSVGDHNVAGGINVQQRAPQQVSTPAEDHPHDGHQSQTLKQHPVKPPIMAGAIVLAGKVHGRLIDRVHGNVDKPLNVGGRGVGRHDDLPEGVDCGLDSHIGQREQGTLDPPGESVPVWIC